MDHLQELNHNVKLKLVVKHVMMILVLAFVDPNALLMKNLMYHLGKFDIKIG